MERKLICIGCPLGCELTAQVEGGEVREVTGNTCPNGERYARKELTNPTRILTTTVRVRGGTLPVVSVKTAGDIPKGKLLACAAALKDVEIPAPMAPGQVVVPDILGTGVDLVATKSVERA